MQTATKAKQSVEQAAEPRAEPSRKSHYVTVKLLLPLILLLAAGVRLWAIDYGLPSLYHPDEPDYAATAQRMFKTGDLNPHAFSYPSLFYYVNAAAYLPFYAAGKMTEQFESRADIPAPQKVVLGIGHTNMPETILMGRLLSVAFSVGTVFLVFLAGRRLNGAHLTGLLAALITAVSATSVVHSRLITPDTYVAFFVMLSVLAALLVFQEGKTWHYALAGLAVGFAASSKYNGAIVVLALVTAHFLRHGRKGITDRKLYMAIGLSGAAFLLGTPFALLDFTTFFAGLSGEARHYSTGHLGMEGETASFYLQQLIYHDGPISLLAALGVAYGMFTRSKPIVLLSVFPLVYLLFVSQFVVRNDRTLLPLLPCVYLLGSVFLVSLFRLARNLRPAVKKALLAGLAALTCICISVPFLDMVTATNARQSGAENRELARKWVENNLTPGSSIAVEAYSTYPDTRRFRVTVLNNLSERTPAQFLEQGFDYVILSDLTLRRLQAQPDRFKTELDRYSSLTSQFELVREFLHFDYGIRVYKVTGP